MYYIKKYAKIFKILFKYKNMWIDTPNNDPLSILPTPKTPEAQAQTPEVKKQPTMSEVLAEVLKKYNINPEEFDKLWILWEAQGLLQDLKDSLTKENKDINLENLVNEAYQEYVKKKLNNETVWDDSEFSIDKIWENLNSNRLNKFNEIIDKYFNAKLEKYDFLDDSQKEFFKINIYNQALENGFLNVINTQTWWVNKLFNDIASSNINIDELIKEMSSQKEWEPKISIAWFDILNKYLSPCLKKFDEIEELFKTKEITDEKVKQSIFSNIDFFKEVNNFSKISDFNVNTIDLTKTKKSERSQNVEQLSEMILKSKDLQEKLSESLAWWAKAEELIYKLSNSELTWQKTSKLMEMLFKIPLFWKMLAWFLGYDTKNPMLDYMDTSKGFGLFDSLTKLWEHKEKNQDWKEGTIEWKWVFKWIKFDIDFTSNKDIFKEIWKTFPELKDKKSYDDFWMKAFLEEWYKQNEKDSFSFQIHNDDFKKLKEDNTIDQKDFSKLINDAFKKYKEDKSKIQEIPAETPIATAKTTTTAENTTAGVQAIESTIEASTEGQTREDTVEPQTTTRDNTPEWAIKINWADEYVDPTYKDQYWNYSVMDSIEIEEIDPYSKESFSQRDNLEVKNKELTQKALDFIYWKNRNEVLSNNITWVFWDLFQFEQISLNKIIHSKKHFDNLLIDKLWEWDYNKLSTENKSILREVLRIFYYYTKDELFKIHDPKKDYNSNPENQFWDRIRNTAIAWLLNSDIALRIDSPVFKDYLKNSLKSYNLTIWQS